MILVDTSVWVDHLRRTDDRLVAALEDEAVLTHPFVIGELACGNLNSRVEILGLLGRLPAAPIATDREALEFIDKRQLMAKGIGYIDVHLLASTALLPGARLWTKDQRLSAIAARMGIDILSPRQLAR